jgi:hypothetical protein
MPLLIMVFVFLDKQILCLQDTLMQIGLEMLMIGKVPLEDVFYVGTNLVAWMSRKQSLISLSTAEAECIAAGSCCTQLLWMKKLVCD